MQPAMLVCGFSVGGEGAPVSVLFVGCLVEAFMVVAFVYAMFCVVRGGARPLLRSPSNTQ